MLADVVHEGGVNPRHERGDGFPGVVGRPIASPTNLELQASGCRGVRTLSNPFPGNQRTIFITVLMEQQPPAITTKKKKRNPSARGSHCLGGSGHPAILIPAPLPADVKVSKSMVHHPATHVVRVRLRNLVSSSLDRYSLGSSWRASVPTSSSL